MTQAQLADGRVLDFPDGTDPTVIQSTVKKVLAQGPATSPAETRQQSQPLETKSYAKERDVDFDTGLTFVDRMALAQADNMAEKQKYLRKVYGNGNVGVTPQGTLIVVRDGKKVAAEGGSKFKGFVADVAGKSPTLTGMAVGAGEGAMLGTPGGPIGMGLGAVGGAVIGGMAGKTVEDLTKMATGTYEKEPDQYVAALRKAGIESAEGEMGGRMITSAASRVLRGRVPPLIAQQTPETDAMTNRALEGGARPPAQSTMPGMKKTQFVEALASKTVGPVPKQDEANAKYIEARISKALARSGLPPDHIAGVVRELASGDSTVPTAEAGQHVANALRAHKEMLESSVQARLGDVQTQLDRNMGQLDKLTRRYATGDLGVDVAGAIKQGRADFGTAMTKVYSRIDSMVGEEPLVPTKIIRDAAGSVARRLPQTVQSSTTRELSKVGAPKPADEATTALFKELGIELPKEPEGKLSFADAQRIRTILREKADGTALTRGVTQGEMSKLANAVDYAIQAAGRDPKAGPAVKLLNAADGAYHKGIQKFNDSTVKRLVRDMDAGLPPDPTEVADRIVQPGFSARVKEIKGLVGQDVWKRVAGADYDNIIRGATDETGKVSGVKLLRAVTERGKLMDEIYGKEMSGRIGELARTVAARDGELDPAMLQPGKIKETIESLRAAETAQNQFMKENALSILADPKKNPEAVYSYLVKPENGSALKEAVKLIGPNSPAVKGVQQAALKDLLSSAKMSVASGNTDVALEKALARYTPEQQKLLFPNGMDEDLHLLSKEIKFTMTKLSDESKASMAAGAILSTPFPVRVPIQIGLGLLQSLLSQPKVIRYLALGLRSPPGPVRTAAKESLMDLVRYGAISPDSDSNQ